MYLTPNMQRVLAEMFSNGGRCTFSSQGVYKTKRFHTDMNRLVRYTSWIVKVPVCRPFDGDVVMEFRLTADGKYVSRCFEHMLKFGNKGVVA